MEAVFYKDRTFELNNQVISWLQKFMEIHLSQHNHPDWFNEVLADLHGNFHVPHGKYFFDDEIIGDDKQKLDYALKMIDSTIDKMKSIDKRGFFELIRDNIKGSWCDISSGFYNDEWLNDSQDYKEKYIASMIRLKEIMSEK